MAKYWNFNYITKNGGKILQGRQKNVQAQNNVEKEQIFFQVQIEYRWSCGRFVREDEEKSWEKKGVEGMGARDLPEGRTPMMMMMMNNITLPQISDNRPHTSDPDL